MDRNEQEERLRELIGITRSGKLTNRDRHELTSVFGISISDILNGTDNQLINKYIQSVVLKKKLAEEDRQLREQKQQHLQKQQQLEQEEKEEGEREDDDQDTNNNDNDNQIDIIDLNINDQQIEEEQEIEVEEKEVEEEEGEKEEEIEVRKDKREYVCDKCKWCDGYEPIRNNNNSNDNCANCKCPLMNHIDSNIDDRDVDYDNYQEYNEDEDEDSYSSQSYN